MTGGEAIRRARGRGRCSQAELARRLGTTPSVLSRWENDQVEPGFATTVRAVEACGVALADVLRELEADPHDLSLIETTLALSIDARMQRVIDYARFVQAGRGAMQQRR